MTSQDAPVRLSPLDAWLAADGPGRIFDDAKRAQVGLNAWLAAGGPGRILDDAPRIQASLNAYVAASGPGAAVRLSASRLESVVAELDASRHALGVRRRRLELDVARHRQDMRRHRLAKSREKKAAATAALVAVLDAHGAADRIIQAERVDRCQRRQERQAPPPRPAPLALCLDIPHGPPLPAMTGDHDMPT